MFHKLGILFFYNEPGLKDMIILTPQWLIEKIGYILRDWDVEGRHPTIKDGVARQKYAMKFEALKRKILFLVTIILFLVTIILFLVTILDI